MIERARQGGITLTIPELKVSLPTIRGDRRRLLQILLNLLTNAVKFTPSGGTVAVRAELTAGGECLIAVADTGIGIPEADLVRVFEPFVQSNRSAHQQGEGTGLGLAICRNLIELHQGRIVIDSGVGKGTEVRVLLPAARVIRSPQTLT